MYIAPSRSLVSRTATARRALAAVPDTRESSASVVGKGLAFAPEPQRQREVAFPQRYYGAHRERVGTAVQGAGALCGSARLCAVAGGKRRARPLPQAGGAAFDEQHLVQVGPAAVTLRTAAVARAAGRASLHRGYSR